VAKKSNVIIIPAEPENKPPCRGEETDEPKERIFTQTIWTSPAAQEAEESESPQFEAEQLSVEEPVRTSSMRSVLPSMPPGKLVIDQHCSTDELEERVRQLEEQNRQLLENFAEMQRHYRSENWQLHQRISALEEMLSMTNQLFDAKIRHALTQRQV
jgi:hypothetical protein